MTLTPGDGGMRAARRAGRPGIAGAAEVAAERGPGDGKSASPPAAIGAAPGGSGEAPASAAGPSPGTAIRRRRHAFRHLDARGAAAGTLRPPRRALAERALYRFPGDAVRVESWLPGALDLLDRAFGLFREGDGARTDDRASSAAPSEADFVIRLAGSAPVVVRTGRDGDARSVLLAGDGVLPGLEREIHRRFVARVAPPRLALHAAAVGLGGGAVLLPGDSGSGKSTLAAALVAAGAEYLGDEIALLDPDVRGSERALPYPKALTLKPGSFSLFPAAGPPDPVGGAERVWYVDAERLRPGSLAGGPLPVTAIVLPRFQAEAPPFELGVPTPGAVALALVRAAVGLPRHGEDGFARLVALAGRAHALAVDFSNVHAAAAAILGRLVREGRR